MCNGHFFDPLAQTSLQIECRFQSFLKRNFIDIFIFRISIFHPLHQAFTFITLLAAMVTVSFLVWTMATIFFVLATVTLSGLSSRGENLMQNISRNFVNYFRFRSANTIETIEEVIDLSASSFELGNLLRTMDDGMDFSISLKYPPWMEKHSHYRVFSGIFPEGMNFHFDGLAVVMSMKFDNGVVRIKTRGVDSEAYGNYDNCNFFGTGTGPTGGDDICFQNPVVNILPISSELWLTVDTFAWARIDPKTLETISGANVDISENPTFTLNAHPACDPISQECYVQHPCKEGGDAQNISVTVDDIPPLFSSFVCVSRLVATKGADVNQWAIKALVVSRAALPQKKLLQHSHSPCITPNFIISKLDSFEPTNSTSKDAEGMLRFVEQGMDNVWLVMNRKTNISTILFSDVHFVNNHFWNCFEKCGDSDDSDCAGGDNEHSSNCTLQIVVDSVPATSDYLRAYFRSSFQANRGGFNWTTMQTPMRCIVSMPPGESVIDESRITASVDGDHQGGALPSVVIPNILCSPLIPATASLVVERALNEGNNNGRTTWSDYATHSLHDNVTSTSSTISGSSTNASSSSRDGSKFFLFDYPTFNPLFKMQSTYQFFYGISPRDPTSVWYDRLLKMNAQTRTIVGEWSGGNGVYLSEATFLPRGHKRMIAGESNEGRNSKDAKYDESVDNRGGAFVPPAEDEGVLLSLLYDAVNDTSYVALLDPLTMTLIDKAMLPSVVPFNAHGIWCSPSRCYTNP